MDEMFESDTKKPGSLATKRQGIRTSESWGTNAGDGNLITPNKRANESLTGPGQEEDVNIGEPVRASARKLADFTSKGRIPVGSFMQMALVCIHGSFVHPVRK